MDRQAHWQQVFTTKSEHDVSWFEALPAMSLQMMEAAGLDGDGCGPRRMTAVGAR